MHCTWNRKTIITEEHRVTGSKVNTLLFSSLVHIRCILRYFAQFLDQWRRVIVAFSRIFKTVGEVKNDWALIHETSTWRHWLKQLWAEFAIDTSYKCWCFAAESASWKGKAGKAAVHVGSGVIAGVAALGANVSCCQHKLFLNYKSVLV